MKKTRVCILVTGLLLMLRAAPADALVGELGGDFSVNNLGAASYTIPLVVSPGTAGMQPRLSISYSSRGGNGALGVGFSLSGLSRISRSAASIHQDGFADPVDFDDHDRFTLDGQRLKLVSPSPVQYGDAGSEYRTEIDNFSRVIANDQAGNGPEWFKVWAKSGLIYEYGHTSSSAFEPTDAGVLSWSVSRISDTVGNYMTFIYTDPEITGKPLISSIDYTGNAALLPYNSVEFVYESRLDTLDRLETLYRAFRDVPMNETKRLEKIIMKNGITHVHEYRLSYTTNEEGQSLLKSIQQFFGTEEGSDNLPKTAFSYSGTVAITQDFSIPIDLTSVASMEVEANIPVLTGDFNDDGKTDVFYVGDSWSNPWIGLSQGDGAFELNLLDIPKFYKNEGTLRTGDFNGDGLMDICQVSGSSSDLWVAFCNGDGTFLVKSGTDFLPTNFSTYQDDAIFVLDVDGDGDDDIFSFRSGGQSRRLARSDGNGNFEIFEDDEVIPATSYYAPDDAILSGDFDGNGFTDIMVIGSLAAHNWVGLSNEDGTFTKFDINDPKFVLRYDPDRRVGTGDFNGDGLTDFYQINEYSGTHAIGLSNGNGTFDFSKSDLLLVDGSSENQTIRTGDFNGDGLTDICRLNSGTGVDSSWIALSKGDGTFVTLEGEAFLPSASAPISNNSGGTQTLVRDFNGDGKTDLLSIVDDDSRWLAISDGDGTFTISTDNAVIPGNLLTDASNDNLSVGDFNGDGMPDVLRLNISYPGNWIGFNSHTQSRMEQVVQQIHLDPAAWPTIQIDYLPLSNTNVYEKGEGAEYPIRDIVPGLYVVETVAKTSTSDTLDNTTFYYTDYTYRSAREHVRGRGFLGFQQFESYDRQTQLAYVKTLAPGFPLTGETLKSETFYIPDLSADPIIKEPIKRIENEWLYDTVSGGTLFAYVSKSVETKWELHQPATKISVVTAWNWYDNQIQSTLPPAPPAEGETPILNGYITHGNVVKTLMDYDVEVGGVSDGVGLIETTASTYTDWVDSAHWLLGRVYTMAVTNEASGQAPVIRSSAFEYDDITGLGVGLLSAGIIEPGDAEFELRTDYFYDGFGNIEREQLSGPGIVTRNVKDVDYDDARGRLIMASRNALDHETTFDYTGEIYQALALPKSSTDPNLLTTEWNYDDLGRTVYEKRPDDTITTHTYSWDTGIQHVKKRVTQVTCVTQTAGQMPLTIWFDKLDREIRSETLKEYTDPATGNPVSRAIYKDTEYNAIGLISSISMPYSGAASMDVGSGSLVEVVAAEEAVYTTMEYDDLKRAIFITAPDGTVTETVYAGLTTQTILDSDETGTSGAKNQITTTVKNTKGEVLRVTDAKNNEVSYTYDPIGNLIETDSPDKNENSNIIAMDHDIRGNKIWQDDPDMGVWTYIYNTLDQLKSQTDANGNVITFEYDLLGRPKKRTNWLNNGGVPEKEGTAEWFYDGSGDGAKLGMLQREEYRDGTGAFINRKTYAYDAYSRLMLELRNYDSKWFYTTLQYDLYSRIETFGRFWRPVGLEGSASQLDPTWHSFITSNTYDENGLLKEVRDDSGHPWWECNTEDYNSEGKLLRFKLGNGLTTSRNFDPLTGWMEGSEIKDSAQLSLSGYGFMYDRIGNLEQRTQTRSVTLTEDYTFDELNRLKTATVVGETPIVVDYDDLGNIETRSDVVGTYSTYQYLSGRPHAVSAAGDCTYMYDDNGNVTFRKRNGIDEFTAIWNSFNKPVSLFDGLVGSEFEYDVNGQRTRQILFEDDGANGIKVRKKIYVAGIYEIEEEVENPSLDRSQWVWVPVHSRIYVDSPTGRIGIYQELASIDGTGSVTKNYLHYDHIGSVVAVSDESETINYYSYDAWGNRRNADTWASIVPADIDLHKPETNVTDRGYTGHEQLDHLQLVHMNGRIYDPVIGRMLTPDPTIPSPLNLQAFNRYSYVYNNPLAFIDPGGLTPEKVGAASSGVTAAELNAANKSSTDNTAAASIGNSGLAKIDSINVTPGGGGGGGGGSLTPKYNEYGEIIGFTDEEGNYYDADSFSDDEVKGLEALYLMEQFNEALKSLNAEDEEFAKGGPDVDDGSSTENGNNFESGKATPKPPYDELDPHLGKSLRVKIKGNTITVTAYLSGDKDVRERFKNAIKGLAGKYGAYELKIDLKDSPDPYNTIDIQNSFVFEYVEAHTIQMWKAYGEAILLNNDRNEVYNYAARHEFGHALGFSHARPGSGSLMSYDMTTMRFSNAEIKRLYNVYK